MADNRQFTDHNEIGGVNVYLEDKKLAESPEKNTVASTDYVLLKDTDDIPHKISKANFVEAVRDALGTVLAGQDNGANIGLVPTLNSTGNTFGSSSLANLASVLCANHPTIKFRKIASEETVNSPSVFKNPGLYLSNDGGLFLIVLYNPNGFGWNFSFNWSGVIQVREVRSNTPQAWVTIAGLE